MVQCILLLRSPGFYEMIFNALMYHLPIETFYLQLSFSERRPDACFFDFFVASTPDGWIKISVNESGMCTSIDPVWSAAVSPAFQAPIFIIQPYAFPNVREYLHIWRLTFSEPYFALISSKDISLL